MEVSADGKKVKFAIKLPNGVVVTVDGTTSSDDPGVQQRLKNAATQLAKSIEEAGEGRPVLNRPAPIQVDINEEE